MYEIIVKKTQFIFSIITGIFSVILFMFKSINKSEKSKAVMWSLLFSIGVWGIIKATMIINPLYVLPIGCLGFVAILVVVIFAVAAIVGY